MGRPKKEVDIGLIEELAGLNCSFEEISHIVLELYIGVMAQSLKRDLKLPKHLLKENSSK